MKKIIFFLIALSFFSLGFAKVYDCFTFFNEYDLLDIRLNELYDEVDYFVIVENPLTHSGNPKPLYFEENKKRYEKFLDKIIHIVGPARKNAKDAWERENKQRNDIMLALKDAKDDDIIMITDLDEIIKAKKVKEIKKHILSGKDPTRLQMDMYRYFINRKDVDIWQLGYAVSYKTLKEYSPQVLRVDFKHTSSIADAGWHFTSLGWVKNVAYKLSSYSHTEWNTKHNKNPKKILKMARRCKFVKIDDTYPKYITENLKYFRDINYIDDNFPMFWNIHVFNKREAKLEKK